MIPIIPIPCLMIQMNSQMTDSAQFTIIRIVSWLLAIGALSAVIFGYESLPDELPVSRWHSSNKTWLLAVRVPLINILSLGLIEMLGRSLSRYDGDSNEYWITPVLLLTAGSKAVIESVEILTLPDSSKIVPLLLAVIVLTGILISLWCGKSLLRNKNWKKMTTTAGEKVVLTVLVAAFIVLNLPLLFG